MDTTTRQILINKMYEIIKEEGLTIPNRILIRQPSRGKQRTNGSTIQSKRFRNNFRITITITSPKYVRDDNGKFWNKENLKERYRCDGWHEQPREQIIHTAAHELAHLKFWNHEAEHESYTIHLCDILTKKLTDWNQPVNS